jgi:hypothetical protein
MIAKQLYVFRSGAICRLSHLGYIVQQGPLGWSQSRIIEDAMGQRLNRSLFCSLNTQEVSMRIQSIRASVEPRDPTGDALLGAAIQMTLRKMDGVAEPDHFAQEIGPMAEALENTGHLLAAGLLSPFVVNLRNFAVRVGVFNQIDLGLVATHDPRLPQYFAL